MGIEIDLLKNYPKTKRDLKQRADEKTEEVRSIARKFDKEFFDGERKYGYGGFKYMSRFWQPVIPTFIEHFNLNENSKLLDVGCAKGFMLFDIKEAIPNITLKGVDISTYAIENAKEEVKPFLQVANAKNLPFEDNSFDVVISINTIHNLEKDECAKALKEIERVSKGKSFITVDAYRNEEEKEAMYAWNLTAKTIMSVEEWKNFFKEVGYTGDYYWFVP
ncbi:methyltransferase type 11 [Halarcobacter ebronensis]|uniref:Methyltransferase type 11 n=1 Tax=Halarcobacter ebronensis TaxID=1462615 RepID=A0A4Q0Y8R2_9BACT|nr:class I SAM-dependent methyltransferase [Halarcobacter ebronensis]RXJ66622.1 methyltransferase type 11 [Halarcobacter ebronensis]